MTEPRSAFEDIRRQYADAVFHKDVARLLALYVDNVLVHDAWRAAAYDGLDAWRAAVKEWLQSLGNERVSVAFHEVRDEIRGDAGFATGIVSYTAISEDGAPLRSLSNRITWVLFRTADGWKIKHEHTSFPVEHGTLRPILKLT